MLNNKLALFLALLYNYFYVNRLSKYNSLYCSTSLP